jgi:hypothetical protein
MPEEPRRHPLCWICGGLATTGEHKTKKSDLRDVFGKDPPTQAVPSYYIATHG